jgi:glutathione S-transferase
MSLTLYSHPFSSYCQKVLVALYENDVEFEYRTLEDPSAMEELKARWPFARFPLLVDDGRTVVESTIIIEHLMLEHGGRVRWLPEDPLAALEVRFLDRFFDNDVMTAMQKPVFAAIKQDTARKDEAMVEARRALDLAYGWLEQRLQGRTWAAGENLSLADCAAAPSLVRRLGARNRGCLSNSAGVPITSPRVACIRASRRRSQAVPALLSAGGAGPRLKA